MLGFSKKSPYGVPYENKGRSPALIALSFICILAVLVLAGFVGYRMWKSSNEGPIGEGYQAVFLTNGQVYFGRIQSKSDEEIVMKDIFYLQVVQPLQGAAGPETQSMSLIKLGKELHGPEDVMYINRSQVLFYENLRTDSSIVQKIREYESGGQ